MLLKSLSIVSKISSKHPMNDNVAIGLGQMQISKRFMELGDKEEAVRIASNIASDAHKAEAFVEISKVLKIIQTFDPPGIAANNLQSCLLIQLEQLNKKNTLSWKIINRFFHFLLSNKINLISKKLKVSQEEIMNSLNSDIANLNFVPTSMAFQDAPRFLEWLMV